MRIVIHIHVICVLRLFLFFLAGEMSKYLTTENIDVKTPLGRKLCPIINEEVILIPILRAGVSMLSGFQRILQKSKTGFIWAHRDSNAQAQLDKYKFPKDIEGKTVVLLDTMLATGGTINISCNLLEKCKPKQIICASILSTKKGLHNLNTDISVVLTAGVSDKLDSNLYVYPGVGDSGDRLYG